MKQMIKISILSISILLTIPIFTSCKDDTDDSLPSLTQTEEEMLIRMREEEKLARDVYDYLYIKYGTMIFDRISNSEQRHMDKVLDLLNKYHIDDPASPNPGEFNSVLLQDLYNELIAQGNLSEVEALKVGATIEDVDIYDLEDYIAQTENTLIINVFEFLNCGSRNHMRGFNEQLVAQGVTYEAQYITATELATILDSSHEQCGGN